MKHKLWLPVIIMMIASLVASCGPGPAPTQPSPAPGEEQGAFPGAARARDAALAYLEDTSATAAPAASTTWTIEDMTPTNLVGSSTLVYRTPADSGEWVVTVTFPIVAP
ncbi:MAG: hypothetical protein ACP5JJ_19950, partial [Anaerolineae bacterium]